MSDGAKFWCFLLLIPFFLSIGHDLWANYGGDAKTRLEAFEIDPHAYQSSDLGYLVVSYVPGVYESARAMVGEEFWMKWIDPVFRLYTFVVALIPFMLFAVWLLIARIFDIGAFADSGRRFKEPPQHLREMRHSGKQYKYTRR